MRTAGLDRQLDRRRAAVAPVEADARARRVGREHEESRSRRWRRGGRRSGKWHERHGERLERLAALDHDRRAVLVVARCAHGERALARLDLEGRERRSAANRPVDLHLGSRQAGSLDRKPPGQRSERVAQHRPALHLDRLLEPPVARLLSLERVAAREGDEPGAHAQHGPGAPQRDPIRRRIHPHLDERQAGQEQQHGPDQPQEGEESHHPARHAALRRRSRAERAGRVRDRHDRLHVRIREGTFRPGRRHQHHGRLRGVRLAGRHDAQDHDLAVDANLDLGARKPQPVGVAQPVRGREPRVVAGDSGSRRRLHEDLVARKTEPGERARRGRHGDRRARPAQRHGKVPGSQAPLAPLVEDAQPGHKASSQRSDTTGAGPPGVRLNCRLTSR